jgi:hypothetical protein
VNVDYWLPDSEERDHKLSDIPSPTDMAEAIKYVQELVQKFLQEPDDEMVNYHLVARRILIALGGK